MLKGDLVTTPLSAVLRQLADGAASGCLHVSDGVGGEAKVYLRGGQVHAVQVPGHRPQLGSRLVSSGSLAPEALAEALEAQRTELQGWRLGELLVHLGYVDQHVVEGFIQEQVREQASDLMRWPAGTWKFRVNERTREDVAPAMPVEALLEQVAARRARWEQVIEVLHGPDAIPALSAAGQTDAEMSIDPEAWSLLCKVDGQRSIAELARECGFTLYEAGEVVLALVRSGLLEVEEVLVDAETAGSSGSVSSRLVAAFAPSPPQPHVAITHPADEPSPADVATLIATALREDRSVTTSYAPPAEEQVDQSIGRVSAALSAWLGPAADESLFAAPKPRIRKVTPPRPPTPAELEREAKAAARAERELKRRSQDAAELAAAQAELEAAKVVAERAAAEAHASDHEADIVNLEQVRVARRDEVAEAERAEIERAAAAAAEQAALEQAATRAEAEQAALEQAAAAEQAAQEALAREQAEQAAWEAAARAEAEQAALEQAAAEQAAQEAAARAEAEQAALEQAALEQAAAEQAAQEAAAAAAAEQAALEQAALEQAAAEQAAQEALAREQAERAAQEALAREQAAREAAARAEAEQAALEQAAAAEQAAQEAAAAEQAAQEAAAAAEQAALEQAALEQAAAAEQAAQEALAREQAEQAAQEAAAAEAEQAAAEQAAAEQAAREAAARAEAERAALEEAELEQATRRAQVEEEFRLALAEQAVAAEYDEAQARREQQERMDLEQAELAREQYDTSSGFAELSATAASSSDVLVVVEPEAFAEQATEVKNTVEQPKAAYRDADTDMASLFRELSSLGMEDEPTPAPRPAAAPGRPPAATTPPKGAAVKKKKGLFGR